MEKSTSEKALTRLRATVNKLGDTWFTSRAKAEVALDSVASALLPFMEKNLAVEGHSFEDIIDGLPVSREKKEELKKAQKDFDEYESEADYESDDDDEEEELESVMMRIYDAMNDILKELEDGKES